MQRVHAHIRAARNVCHAPALFVYQPNGVGPKLGRVQPSLLSQGQPSKERSTLRKVSTELGPDHYVHESAREAHLGDSATFDPLGQHHRLVSDMRSILRLAVDAAGDIRDDSHLIVAYWVFPNLVIAHQRWTIDLDQFQPGGDQGSCVLRHTSLARRASLPESERPEYEAIWEAVSCVFLGKDGAALERPGEGLACSTREFLLIGRNEPGMQSIVRTLSAAGAERSISSLRTRPDTPDVL